MTVQGRAEFLPDGPERRALVDRFHEKYRGLEKLWGGKAMPANRVMFRIVPSRVRSWGLMMTSPAASAGCTRAPGRPAARVSAERRRVRAD